MEWNGEEMEYKIINQMQENYFFTRFREKKKNTEIHVHTNSTEGVQREKNIFSEQTNKNRGKNVSQRTRNSPPLPSSSSSTYPSFDIGFNACHATVTELFTVEQSS